MARGRDQHHARQAAIAGLGRTLTRRANSSCELCGQRETLRVIEVPPFPEHPNEEAAILACECCRLQFEAKAPNPEQLRFLEASVWSETIPVQIASVLLLRRLAISDVDWAKDCLEGIWLDENIQTRLDSI